MTRYHLEKLKTLLIKDLDFQEVNQILEVSSLGELISFLEYTGRTEAQAYEFLLERAMEKWCR